VTLYEVETRLREEGWPSDEFVYDWEHDLYHMADGEIAFSREYANERRLREDGFIG
jgi:ketosteroid isomerase-like protein